MAVVQVNPTPTQWPPQRPPTPPSNPSFLYSEHRRIIDESRRKFLSLSSTTCQPPQGAVETMNRPRAPPSKKISFKVKKTASIYRRGGKMGTVGVASNVAQLASKFNQMNKGSPEENKVGGMSYHYCNQVISQFYLDLFKYSLR